MRLKKEYLNDSLMKLKKAKKTIDLLSRQWKIENQNFVSWVIEGLWLDGITDKQDFEFSFIENENKIRLNHIFFLSSKRENRQGNKVFEERMKKFSLVVDRFEKRFSIKYNKTIFEKAVSFARSNRNFPLQIGLEYDIKMKPRIKIYFSINAKRFPLKEFCQLFDFNIEANDNILLKKEFDTIAVDFLPDENISFKLYPLISNDSGLLIRFSQQGGVLSKKIWHRFPNGVSMQSFRKSNFLSVPIFLQRYITLNKMKIYYLGVENSKRSFYFR